VKSDGTVSTRKINRRQLLKSSGELNAINLALMHLCY